MSEGDGQKDTPKISRRDFLKLTGLAGVSLAAGTSLGRLLTKISESHAPIEAGPIATIEPPATIEPTPTIEPLALTPEVIDGVKVYGLKEKITSVSDVESFYAHLDNQFVRANDIQIRDKREQRKELLDPNERYLEVAVRRSAYDSFVRKQAETGVGFPGWIRIHVDMMNRCMESAKPQAEMKTVLRRILVIEDDMAKDFWDEKAFRGGKGPALDSAWRGKFDTARPIDTDGSWAIADDYRDSGGTYFWDIRHGKGKIIVGQRLENVPRGDYFEFPKKDDFLSGKDNASFDMGLIHEWSHRLLSLPDEYAQDVHDTARRFKDFFFGTGSFCSRPYFSPYLSYETRERINLNERGMSDRTYKCFYERPKKISLDVGLDGLRDPHLEIRIVRANSGLRGHKKVPRRADKISSGTSIELGDDLFDGRSNCWLLTITDSLTSREVFLPAAAFNMSKIAGLESVKYNLIFSGHDDVGRTRQEVKLVDETDLDKLLNTSQNPVYAKMKIEGTNAWLVWFLVL